ncbi:hypothetical protein JVU11DRAFT_5912 [Chiua virens]|nr:hypothetical protein JVU11DRAFT_5912 [Chiua virens]
MSTPMKEKAANTAKAKVQMPGPSQDCQPYAPGGVADLCSTLFRETFMVLQRLAASHALLQHGAHVDSTDNKPRTPGGLHPSYFGFQELKGGSTRLSLGHEDFKEVCMCDLFDTVVQQDRLDSGISLLLHCPGFTAQPNLGPENIIADVYVTLHVLDASQQQKMNENIAILIQGFCQEFALPHLHQFTKLCDIEGIGPIPPPPHAPSIMLNSPPFLPPAAIEGTCIRCSAQPYVTQAVVNSSFSGAKRVTSNVTKSSSAENDRCNADRFSPDEVAKAILDATSDSESGKPESPIVAKSTARTHAIISIGANTDAVLNRFGLSDQLIPHLRELVVSVHSSQWEAML